MSGLIGGLARQQLKGKYELTGLNRSEVPGVKCVQADLSDLEAIRPAFEGQDVVIHLAAKLGADFSWQEFQDTNIAGKWHWRVLAGKSRAKAGTTRLHGWCRFFV